MIILGSKSPRRKQLLSDDITTNFKVENVNINEEESYSLKPIDAVKDIARRKGEYIAKKFPNDVIICADTIVILNKEIIGKPKNAKDAYSILKKLSNKKHMVVTAYFVKNNKKIILDYVKSYVTFKELDDDLIWSYIDSGSPLDKAGAYGIQDKDKFDIIKNVKGSIKNVIGFPSNQIYKALKKLKVKF